MVDKETLFKSRLAEREVDIPGVGTVRVRSLSRKEAVRLQTETAGNADAIDRKLLAWGLVDPELTEEEVDRWRDASPPGELEPLTDAIAELSGLGEDAVKEAVRSFRDGAGPETGVPPGPDAGDDSR